MLSLRQACEQSPAPSLLCAADGVVHAANDAAHHVLGHEAGALVGRRLRDLVAPESREAFVTAMGVDQVPRAAELETDLQRADGTVFRCHLSGLVFAGPRGAPVAWVTLRDLSAAEALARSEAAFRALGEATSEAVVLHRGGRIVLTNAAARSMFRAPLSAGRVLLDFIAPEEHADVVARIARRSDAPYESVAMRGDGTRFPVEARGATVRYQGETLRVATIRDLTERRQLERRLAVSDRLASMGMLASGVAHEINNPLAFVMLQLEQVLGRLGPEAEPEVVGSLRQALRGADRIRGIVDDLRQLAVAGPQEGESANVGEALDRAATVGGQALRHAATLRGDGLRDLWVATTPGRLGQVFLNLLLNAAQAIGPGAADAHEIRVTGGIDPSDPCMARIEVADTGPGVRADLLPHLFDPFVTTASTSSSMGVGLSIVHRLVTSSGGTIDVESVLGEGTTFVVRLPRATPGDPVASPEPAPRARQQGLRRSRVLLVDDEKGVRDVLCSLMEEAYDVVTADSGKRALELLEERQDYAVVLCDWLMPHMGGEELLEVVRRRWPELVRRWVVMSGGITDASGGAPDGEPVLHLFKPFRAAQLFAAIAEVRQRAPAGG